MPNNEFYTTDRQAAFDMLSEGAPVHRDVILEQFVTSHLGLSNAEVQADENQVTVTIASIDHSCEIFHFANRQDLQAFSDILNGRKVAVNIGIIQPHVLVTKIGIAEYEI